jgi:hypothetical protein
LLCSDIDTSNEMTTTARQQLRKYATVTEPSLGNVKNNGRNVGNGVFYSVLVAAR